MKSRMTSAWSTGLPFVSTTLPRMVPTWAAAAVGILAGAGLYFSAVVASAIVLVILEINRLPLYRRIDPVKAQRHEATGGYDHRFGTTPFPARPRNEPPSAED